MRTAPALATLAVTATALLAACGEQTPTADESPEPSTPSYSVITSAPASPSTAASESPSTSPSGAPSPTGAPSSTPTTEPSPPATSGAPSAPSAPAAGGTIHKYKDLTLRLPVSDDAVPDAPAGMIEFARQSLEADWKRLGHTAGCEKGGMVTVTATRSDGFAYVMRDVDPSLENCPKAASMAGGYRAVWKDVDGTWKEVLGMQDVPPCSDFEKWDVPSALLGMDAQCLRGDDVVPYQHA